MHPIHMKNLLKLNAEKYKNKSEDMFLFHSQIKCRMLIYNGVYVKKFLNNHFCHNIKLNFSDYL